MNVKNPSGAMGDYLQSIFLLLDRVEYRRMTTMADMLEIERLRRSAYESKMLIDPDVFGDLIDEDDYADDCFVIGVYIDEQLVSTVRLHIVSADRLHGSSAKMCEKTTLSLLANGDCIVDPSRFATDPAALWKYPSIPLLTLRAAAMALEYFHASHLVGVVREDAAQFYIRCFGGKAESAPFAQKGFIAPLVMLSCPIEGIREKIETRYPFFKSQAYERKLMFAPQTQLSYPSLNILPSAKFAYAFCKNIASASISELLPS